ncbi:hypothetical protein [Dapis sp. BLCC M172]|uniref:hypothetical protein n=1 Tax=Dapis sp. BLCC M172 TaxID=2975281 RepID=UPI003CF59DA1
MHSNPKQNNCVWCFHNSHSTPTNAYSYRSGSIGIINIVNLGVRSQESEVRREENLETFALG